MKLRFSHLALIGFAALAAAVEASPTSDLLAVRRARTKSVKMGIWHADLNKARAFAEENGMPLIAVWSNGEDCSHCLVFERMAMSPVFREWMATSGYVFYFGVRDDGPNGPTSDGQEGYHGTSFYWCRMKDGSYDPNASRNWPYVRIYWRKATGKLKLDMFETGAALDGEYDALPMPASRGCVDNPKKFVVKGDDGTYNPSARYFIDKLTNKDYGYLRNYVYNPTPKYTGGEFAVPDVKQKPDAGMQLECSATAYDSSFILPLSRTNSTAQATASTNTVICTYPSGVAKTNTVYWSAGQATANVEIRVKNTYLKQNQYAEIVLLDASMSGVATNHVKCVAPVANSPKNPYWIGERTKSTLGWGEWTMDLDMAKAKVSDKAAKGRKAYTLVLIGGPLWCPDCVNLEDHLIESAEFKAWATNSEHLVSCVAIDEPNFNRTSFDPKTAAPTLLSHTVYKDSKSGTGYLTRKMIPLDGNGGINATAVLKRNLDLVSKDLDHGGFLLPEPAGSTAKKTGTWKTGIPCIVLMDSNGRTIGRISQFSNSSSQMSKTDPAILVKRLDEMLQQEADSAEERNDSCWATADRLGNAELVGTTRTLSFTDAADYFRLDMTKGTDIFFNVVPEEKGATVVASIIDGSRADPDAAPLAVVTNDWNGGYLEGLNLPSDNCYLKVSYPTDSACYPTNPYYSLDKDGSTVVHYTIEGFSILRATDVAYTVTNMTDQIGIYLTAGQEYVFEGLDLDGENTKAALTYDEGTGRCVAKTSDVAMLDLIQTPEGAYVLTYQQWKPGIVGFEKTSAAYPEPKEDVEYVINIRRSGGLSGTARVRIGLVPGESTSITDGTVYVWNDADRVFVWNEGENDVKSTVVTIKGNDLPDGDQILTFELVQDGGDAPVNEAQTKFVLTIRDDDEPIPGTLSLVSAGVDEGAVPVTIRSGSTVFSPGGSVLKVTVERQGGAAGMVGCSLSVPGAEVAEASRIWNARETGAKTFTVTLPAFEAGAANVLTATLSGLDGSQVEAAAKYFTIRVTPSDGVKFEQDTLALARTRYVEHEEQEAVILWQTCSSYGADRTVKLVSGTLPPGMDANFDPTRGTQLDADEYSGAMVLMGTPTKAGLFTAVYQAFEDGVPGGLLTVNVNVSDPVALPPTSSEANPSLANTRTFSDILVVDPSRECVVGLLTLTIPRSGRLSARYRTLEGVSAAFLSESWSGVSAGTYSAVLASVDSIGGLVLEVAVAPDGAVSVQMTDPVYGGTFVCYVSASEWSEAKPAAAWKGCYNVSMPQLAVEGKAFAAGDGFVQLRMTEDLAMSRGAMIYAGVLPSGRAFSGSGTLADYSGPGMTFGPTERALPILSASSGDLLTAVCLVDYAADPCRKVFSIDGVMPLWRHSESVEEASYEVQMDAVGCLYDPSVDFVGCCTNKFGTLALKFFATTTNLVADAGFTVNGAKAWQVENAMVSVTRNSAGTNKIKVTEDAAKNGLTLDFLAENRANGIVSGTFRLDFADGPSRTVAYRGIVMPGWGTRDCSTCSDQECDKRPFVSGTCWFDDDYNYQDLRGRSRAISVKRGFPFSIGVVEGQ